MKGKEETGSRKMIIGKKVGGPAWLTGLCSQCIRFAELSLYPGISQ